MLQGLFSKFKKLVAIYLIIKFTLLIGFIYIYHDTFFKHHTEQEVIVMIPKGASTKEISDQLFKERVIQSKYLFVMVAKLLSLNKKYLHPGEYDFGVHSTLMDVMDKLIKGDVIAHKVTIPEGLTNHEVAKILNNTYGLTGELNPKQYQEGYLLPETYIYHYGDTKESIFNRMHLGMQHLLENSKDIPLPFPLQNQHELLTLASIVEKETHLNVEKPRVARVYLNRLKHHMLLQADPTVIYGITLGMTDFKRKVLFEDLKIDSPYNTYKVLGLPPTPITNPGIESILAVLHPSSTNELFFVADGYGGHKFSSNYREHTQNISALRANTKAH